MTENYEVPISSSNIRFSYALFLISLWKEQLTQPHKNVFNFVINLHIIKNDLRIPHRMASSATLEKYNGCPSTIMSS